jgi:hypothetical protein
MHYCAELFDGEPKQAGLAGACGRYFEDVVGASLGLPEVVYPGRTSLEEQACRSLQVVN